MERRTDIDELGELVHRLAGELAGMNRRITNLENTMVKCVENLNAAHGAVKAHDHAIRILGGITDDQPGRVLN